MSILVSGTIDFDSSKRDAAVTERMVATRAEEGCERYVFSGDLSDQGRLRVRAVGLQEAMDTHMATPHLAELMGATGSLGVTAASFTKWDGATASTLM